MRVWLIDDKPPGSTGALEACLRRLEERQGTEFRLLGTSNFQADLATAMRKLGPDLLDVLILNERVCPADGEWLKDVLTLDAGLVLAVAPDRVARFRASADLHPINFVGAAPSADELWLASLGAKAAHNREGHWKKELAHLQQRLADRIVIERAKGILVQRLHISEEEAYKRLRILSRRQRRQIRDIAQSLLDTEFLYSSEVNGTPKPSAESAQAPEEPLP